MNEKGDAKDDYQQGHQADIGQLDLQLNQVDLGAEFFPDFANLFPLFKLLGLNGLECLGVNPKRELVVTFAGAFQLGFFLKDRLLLFFKFFESSLKFSLRLLFKIHDRGERTVLVSTADVDQCVVAKVIDKILHERDVLTDAEALLQDEMVIDENVRIADEADVVVFLGLGQVFSGSGLACAGFRRTGILGGRFAIGKGGREFAAKFQCQCVFFGAGVCRLRCRSGTSP